jgi:ABC-type polysaccharide/polyol phosphate transport system ATPase subunit
VTSMIFCKDLWKSFHRHPPFGLKELLVGRKTLHHSKFFREWALRDVTFSVEQGTAFGIVGHNGTGKSTLLALLLGTMAPDKGQLHVSGRVASLLELGAGFHPELTGRENIFLYGAILGMTLREIKRLFQQIVEFSELEEAIENPIRTYSSGMVTRLGFSVIIHAPADLLLIDEVLGVGDMRFQQKCMDKLREFKRNGGTLVIVSHDMETLAAVCSNGMCLNEGKVLKIGAMNDVIQYYREMMGSMNSVA